MFNFLKPKKKNQTVELKKKEIESGKFFFLTFPFYSFLIPEIESLADFKVGMKLNPKDMGSEFHVDVMIEKNIIGFVSEIAKERVPHTVVFLIVIMQGYPNVPPQILTKSNFCSPSLMDGRDLMKEICPVWNIKGGFKQILEGFLPFLSRVINAKGYKFYGAFHLGATYNLKNFDNMIVVRFDCTVEENDNKKNMIQSLKVNFDYELILTEDCFLLFEKLDSTTGKIVFWSSLFSITDLQLNKLKKICTINFYDEEVNTDYQIKLKIDYILLFRDSLVKKMKSLKVKVESQKLIKGQTLNRLSEKEIKNMKINDIEKNVKELRERIIKGEINDYTVNTLTHLCGRAIEHFSQIGDEKYKEYMNIMKEVLSLDGVDKLTKENENEINENSDI